jgi:hypothetical protein
MHMQPANKKVYSAPKVEVHGSMQELTRGATGLNKDGGAGGKSKATGAA